MRQAIARIMFIAAGVIAFVVDATFALVILAIVAGAL